MGAKCSCGCDATVEYEPGGWAIAKRQLELSIARHRRSCSGEITLMVDPPPTPPI